MPLQVSAPIQALEPTTDAAAIPQWYPVCHITYNRDSWVKLLEPLNDYSFDEAKLLCQEGSNHWVAWVPDHGEAILDRSQFYC